MDDRAFDEDDELDDDDVVYCGFPTCDNEAVTEVPVSNDAAHVTMRPACYSCSEVYHTGAQYGRFRAYRQLQTVVQDHLDACDAGLAQMIDFAADEVRDNTDDPALDGERKGG